MKSIKRTIQVLLLVLCLSLLVGLRLSKSHALPEVKNWNESQLARLGSGSSKEFSFAVLADSQSHFSVFAYHLNRIKRAGDLDFIINVGDLVDPAKRVEFDEFFSLVYEVVDRPLLTAKGNQDVSDDRLYEQYCGAPYYSFTYNGSSFIVLDEADRTGLGGVQTRWLENELQISQGFKSRMVFIHVPPIDPRDPLVEKNDHGLPEGEGRRIVSLFKKYHVSHVFSGHIHSYYSGEWDGVPYTISGGGGARLVGKNPEHSFNHFLRVTVGNDGAVVVEPQRPAFGGLPVVGPVVSRLWAKLIGRLQMQWREAGLAAVAVSMALMLTLPLDRGRRRSAKIMKVEGIC